VHSYTFGHLEDNLITGIKKLSSTLTMNSANSIVKKKLDKWAHGMYDKNSP